MDRPIHIHADTHIDIYILYLAIYTHTHTVYINFGSLIELCIFVFVLLIKNHFDVQDLLTRHKVLVAEHLEQNYDAVSDPALMHAHMHRPTSMHFYLCEDFSRQNVLPRD